MTGMDLEEKQLQSASEQTIKDVWSRYDVLLSIKDILIGIILLLVGHILPLPTLDHSATDARQFIVGYQRDYRLVSPYLKLHG